MYSVKLILDELLYGSRVIITNVPLNLPRLNEYLQQQYPNKSIDLFERIRMLDEDMTGRFWTYRPKGRDEWLRIKELTKQEWTEGKKPSYAEVTDKGVMYVIDECHNFFNARAWAETGRDVLFYLSQHRHLGDTVVWITQAVMNVDKQFRSVTQDYTYIRNLSKEKMGLFRLPSRFIRKTYGSPATETSQPMEIGTFKLDCTGLASLYSTAAGVGIHDRGNADIGERKRGIHWGVFVVAVPLLVFALYRFAPSAVAALFDSKRRAARALAAQARTPPARQPERPTPPNPAPVTEPAQPHASGSNRVEMTGYSVLPLIRDGFVLPRRLVTVYLSDGTQWVGGDGHLQYLCERFCVVDGRTNWYHAKETPVAAQNREPEPVQPIASPAGPADEPPSEGSSSVYVIPWHVNTLAHPNIRSAISGAAGQQN